MPSSWEVRFQIPVVMIGVKVKVESDTSQELGLPDYLKAARWDWSPKVSQSEFWLYKSSHFFMNLVTKVTEFRRNT